MFCDETPATRKLVAKRILNIHQEGGQGKYLGLPEHFGRKKKDIFTIIVDRIRQKALSWSNRFLSTAGKEVLIKAVLSAIPTYTMSCFKLPKSLIKRIQSALTRFWWDDKHDKRKISWVSWSTLSKHKACGGLGFKDIEAYNVSLLAKLSWRLLQAPNTLASRILLSKYCQDSSILSCTLRNNASYGWQGILLGRDLLRKGLGWIVGDGKHISVWSDAWLDPTSPSRPLGPPPLCTSNMVVADLITETTRQWNWPLIMEVIPSHHHQIQLLHLSSATRDDKCVWLPSKSGTYSPKSGYELGLQLQERDYALRMDATFDWKKNVWRVATQPKIRSFLWKALCGALAVGSQLQARGMTDNLRCKVCGEVESIDHVLLLCRFAQEVWVLAPVTLSQFAAPPSISTFLAASSTFKALPPTGLSHAALFSWILWGLWLARNERIFSDGHITPAEVISKALVAGRTWQQAQTKTHTTRHTHTDTTSFFGIKCYVDAAWNPTTLSCGAGWYFRSDTDHSLGDFSDSMSFISSALMAEVWAMLLALRRARAQGIQELHVFSDSQLLVTHLNQDSCDITIDTHLHDIRLIIPEFSSISFHFIPRSLNNLADSLAKSALRIFDTSG